MASQAIYSGQLGAGTYTVSITSQSNADNANDGVGAVAYVFPVSATTSTVVGTNIATCGSGLSSCAVTVASGGATYIYDATEGGSYSISAIDYTQDLGVINPSNLESVSIGHSSSNTGTFNPDGALYPNPYRTGWILEDVQYHNAY